MFPGRLPSPLTDKQIRAAMDAAVRDSLRPLTAVMTAIYLVPEAALVLGFGPLGTRLAVLEFSAAVLCFAIHVVVRRVHVADRYVYPVLVLLTAISLLDATVQLFVLQDPRLDKFRAHPRRDRHDLAIARLVDPLRRGHLDLLG